MRRNSIGVVIGIFGLLLLALAFWQVGAAASGLRIFSTNVDGLPIVFITPAGAADGERPLVLIGHGYAGSGVIMRGFAYTLAKAGFSTALVDFAGHGQNSNPLPSGMMRGDLLPDAEAALAEARRLGIGDPDRLAILGHSMGSGVALSFGQVHPETVATIAVSPVGTNVTPVLPRNLLLMAGSNEASFLQNARQRLAEAGGQGGDPGLGTARKLVIIPGVEHITIVFSPLAHREARQWLEAVFGAQPGAVDYTDRRILWYGLGLLGAFLASLALIPPTVASTASPTRRLWRRGLVLPGGALVATLLLALITRLGLNLMGFLGLMVGGYLLVWFAIAGLVALLFLNGGAGGSFWAWLKWPGGKIILSGLLVALILWVGMGLLGGQVWLPWLLIPPRLVLWPLAVICLLPWFLVIGQVSSRARPWGRLGWWLMHSLVVVTGLLFSMRITPGVSSLLLILPLFPLILGAQSLAAGRQRHPWAFGLSAALFIAWVILAVFPLSA